MWANRSKAGEEGGGGGAGEGAREAEVKVVLVGDTQCGKTALVQRFTADTYTETYAPTGFEKYGCSCGVSDHTVHFSVWDTSGTAAYDTVRPLAYQDARVFMLCFDVAEPDSLDNIVHKWYQEVRAHGGLTAPVILCGCKADLRQDAACRAALAKLQARPVTSEQALSVARQIAATTYVETSARTAGKAVRDAFEVAALAALGKLNKQQKQVGRSKSKRDLKAALKGRAKSCCVM